MLQPGMLLQDRYQVIRLLGSGGFGETYEVDDRGTVKVLKVLRENFPKFILFFEREAKGLSQLKHPGIPKVEQDGYFCFYLEGIQEPLYCLVMEKIPGVDLKQWLSTHRHQPITQTLAIQWLKQLVEILDRIHPQFFHRDIKPSNIMLKPDGQLVLIDFGGIRERTETYLQKHQGDLTSTRGLQSRGYTPGEQIEGRGELRSDFFALGRTFVHLLTGKHPSEFLSNPDTGLLIWRSDAPHISSSLADLIDWLMQPFPGKRPQNPQEILQALAKVENGEAIEPLLTYQGTTQLPSDCLESQNQVVITRKSVPRWRQFPSVLLWSMMVSGCVMGVRSLGLLQSLELKAYDQMLQMRSHEAPDNRLLIVEVTKQDIEQFSDQYPISDLMMLRLLRKLNESQPQVIGLDIYRDTPEGKGRADLVQYLQRSNHIFSPCVHPVGNKGGIQSPMGISGNRVGFVDVLKDKDGIVRRHLLAIDPPDKSQCSAHYALSSQLALHYLAAKGYSLNFSATSSWRIHPISFDVLKGNIGFYQQEEMLGHQILLNSRAGNSPDNIAERVTLTQVLANQVNPHQIKGRIILIGVTDSRLAKDEFHTSYNPQIRGLLLHAQMVSQLVSAVEDRRPLLRFWPLWGDFIWVSGWSLLGSLLMKRFCSFLSLGLVGGILLISLSGSSFILLLKEGTLVPLVPSVFALLITEGIVISNTQFKAQEQK